MAIQPRSVSDTNHSRFAVTVGLYALICSTVSWAAFSLPDFAGSFSGMASPSEASSGARGGGVGATCAKSKSPMALTMTRDLFAIY